MRRAGPILIVVIGVIALIVSFAPGLRLPDSTASDGQWRLIETKLGLDLEGGLRVEYQALPKDGQNPTPESMGVIKDIIENRVNTDRRVRTGRPRAGQRPGRRRAPRRVRRRQRPPPRRPDGPARLRAAPGRVPQNPPAPGTELPRDTYPPLFSGDQIQSAAIGQDPNGRLAVDFKLKGGSPTAGSELFAEYTTNHAASCFAITLDERVISAPSINSPIVGGTVQITGGGLGGFPANEANELVTVLKFGSLPFPIDEVSSEQITATLGDQFLSQTLLAGVIGIALVVAFMLLFYRLPGVVASFALVYYTIVVYAIFRIIPVTLTLAGIAGFVLSVGMAVDANILIFERMKEELRVGKSLPAAVEAGFNRAWNSILDSNVSSLITATILYAFGSSRHPWLRARPDHRRARLDVQRDRRDPFDHARRRPPGLGPQGQPVRAARRRVRGTRAPSVRRPDDRCVPMFDVIGKRRSFYIISLALTIPGLVFILLTPFTRRGLQFTIDYTGGTRWELQFEDPTVTPEQVVAVFEANDLEAVPSITSTGYIEIKTEPIGLQPAPVPSAASPSGSLGQRSGVAGRVRLGRADRVAVGHARLSRHRRPVRRAGRQHGAPDRRAVSARWSSPSRPSSVRSRNRRR